MYFVLTDDPVDAWPTSKEVFSLSYSKWRPEVSIPQTAITATRSIYSALLCCIMSIFILVYRITAAVQSELW